MAFTLFPQNELKLDPVIQYVLPYLKQHPFIKVWDAGCAVGPEPYSIAITLRENLGANQFRNVRIYATDIGEMHFAETIARGIYPDAELAQIPRDLFVKYFKPNGKPSHFQANGELRRAVYFHRHDLLSLQPILNDFGLIVCKNVLPRFTPSQRADVVRMFHRALARDGYLVLEQAQNLPYGTERLFHRVTPSAQLYRKA
jgi:chemotaxis protein methyltransferase CheR